MRTQFLSQSIGVAPALELTALAEGCWLVPLIGYIAGYVSFVN